MVTIHPTARLRKSPFYESTVAEGITSASVYNRMIMPTSYGDPLAEYWRLIRGVSQWDVAVERQVQLKGPDAGALAQILTPRDLSTCKVGQGKYAPLCNHGGVVINDPILLKLADDLYWFSIADSDIWLWARAIAAERRLDVEITEPDVSPMAIQGPKAEAVVTSVCGDWVRELKYFWFRETEIEGIPVAVQRSSWSKQGGFEIYLRDGSRGMRLWDIFRGRGVRSTSDPVRLRRPNGPRVDCSRSAATPTVLPTHSRSGLASMLISTSETTSSASRRFVRLQREEPRGNNSA